MVRSTEAFLQASSETLGEEAVEHWVHCGVEVQGNEGQGRKEAHPEGGVWVDVPVEHQKPHVMRKNAHGKREEHKDQKTHNFTPRGQHAVGHGRLGAMCAIATCERLYCTGFGGVIWLVRPSELRSVRVPDRKRLGNYPVLALGMRALIMKARGSHASHLKCIVFVTVTAGNATSKRLMPEHATFIAPGGFLSCRPWPGRWRSVSV